jgi:hypothetical protein
VQAEIGNQQEQRAAFGPDDDGVIQTYGHASLWPRRAGRLSPACQPTVIRLL